MIVPAAVLTIAVLQAPASTPGVDDPALRAAVQRFYETQEQEDVAGYLALWSAKAQPPPAAQLKFIFDSGDDKFSEIEITRVTESRGRVRVRVDVLRVRTPSARPGGFLPPAVTSRMQAALTFEKEGDEWKLVREGQAADDLALVVMEAASDAEREAALASEPDLIGPQLLTAFARLGGAASVKQDYAGALKIYEQLALVARRHGFKKEEAEALQNIANAHYFLRRLPEALAAYEQRLAIDRERGDAAGVAAALSGIATIRYSFAEYTEALARYREALAIQERLDDVAGIAFTTISIGNIAYLQGDFQAAIAAYRRSFDLNRTMSHADGESRALEGLGRVFAAQGDYAAALDSFDAVLNDKRLQHARGRLGSAAQNVGDVHFRLGNLEAAKAKYNESRVHFEAAKDTSNVGRVLQGSALTELVAGQFATAEDLYVRSGTICRTADDTACTAAATAGLAYAQAAQEKYWDAAASYRKAVSEFEALGRREEVARSEVGLSQALAGAGDTAGAVDAAIRARHIAIALESDDVLWRALTAEARAVRKLGDVGDKERALGVARAAVSVLDRLQAAALDKPGTSLSSDAAGALATFAVLQAEAGDAIGAFATSERLRVLDIRAGLATNEREIARGMTDDERIEERTLAAQVLTRFAQLSREKGLPKPDGARVAELEKTLDTAREARRGWMRGLFERHPQLRVWRGLGPPREARDAARVLLERGQMILSFVVDDEDLVVITLARQDGESGVLPHLVVESNVTHVNRRHINAAVQALQQAAARNDAQAWQTAIEELARAIPPSVHARLASASKVMIIPHDVLWRVPFEALPSGDSLLGDRALISLAGSVDSLIHASAITITPSARGLVGIGAPDLPPERTMRFSRVAPGWMLRAPDAADLELKAVAGAYGRETSTILSSTSATEAAVRGQRNAAQLHVAAPFRINAASPLFSAIVLTAPTPLATDSAVAADGPAAQASSPSAAAPSSTARPKSAPPASSSPAQSEPASPGRDPADDGSLELREVMNLDVGARVAVFSDGAATSMRDGAAAADVMQWGWLAAGVPSVLVARWTAPPTAGAQLLSEFHKQLQAGAEPAAALRTAQQVVRGNPATASPINWAGWMLLGVR